MVDDSQRLGLSVFVCVVDVFLRRLYLKWWIEGDWVDVEWSVALSGGGSGDSGVGDRRVHTDGGGRVCEGTCSQRRCRRLVDTGSTYGAWRRRPVRIHRSDTVADGVPFCDRSTTSAADVMWPITTASICRVIIITPCCVSQTNKIYLLSRDNFMLFSLSVLATKWISCWLC